MKKMTLLFLSAILISGPVTGQTGKDRGPVGPSCRREIIKLCGLTRDRMAIRTCLREKFASLSPDCLSDLSASRIARTANAIAPVGGTEYTYGSATKQKLDFWQAPAGTTRPPLVIFIHGGGWSIGDKASGTGAKPAHFNGLGYAFASLNYRLVPEVKPDDQARDIASAIAWLRSQAGNLGFDPDRIILSGHSAGAHLAALVSSDTRYLGSAGVPVEAIKGVILLDGAGYDVPRQMAGGAGAMLGKMYSDAFGADRNNQLRLSPITHATRPNVNNWLLLYVSERSDSRMQSEDMAEVLRLAGNKARAIAVTNTNHMQLNRNIGLGGDPATAVIDDFIKQAL